MNDTTAHHRTNSANPVLAEEQRLTVPVVEEQLTVGKTEVVTGAVRLTKSVDFEERTLKLERTDREVNVERRPVNQTFDTPPPAVRQEGGKTIYSVIREVPVVVTRYELVEEIVVEQRAVTTEQPTVIPTRAERVEVTHIDNPRAPR